MPPRHSVLIARRSWPAGPAFCSGTAGINPLTGTVPDGAAAQTEQALVNLAAILEAAGATMADVVKTTIFYTDVADYPAINEVYNRHMPDPPPARWAPAKCRTAPRSVGLDRRDRGYPQRASVRGSRGLPSPGPIKLGSRARCGACSSALNAGVDHRCVGDHVSFFVGAGSDGLITATSLLRHQADLGPRRALPAAVAPPGSTRPSARDSRATRAWPARTRHRDRRRGSPRGRDLRGRPEDGDADEGGPPSDPAQPCRGEADDLRR